jgi:thiosulfate/3-mercaptopyruvate sulfurtransferase
MDPIPSVVPAARLAELLHSPDTIVVDCRFDLTAPESGRQQYLESHIPGARYLNLDRDLSGPPGRHGGRHPLPAPATLARTLTEIGVVSGRSHVIAYDSSRFAFSSRLWWLSRYLGHDRFSLLDGGWQEWQELGYPVTSVVPVPTAGRFIPAPRSEWVVSIEGVRSRPLPPLSVLIDSRSEERYRGEREPIDPIAGHIRGAVNYPWMEIADERGFLRPETFHRRRWQGLPPGSEAIVYCGSGVTACANILSLAIGGYDNVKLYAGGWSDWCSYLT